MTYGHAATIFRGRPPQTTQDEARQRAFGAVVRRHREDHGWSRQQLGDQVNWPSSSIALIENGQRVSTLRSIYSVADALGVSPILLLADVEVLLADQDREAMS